MGLEAFANGIAFPIGTDLSGLKTGLSEAGGELDKTESKFSSFSATLQQHGVAIGAAMTGAGVAIVALADDARKTNATLGTTGLQLGVTTEEMRALALSTTNVTFPLENVTATFDLLTRAGMRDTDQLKKTATAFDTLGDAIGMSAQDVTDVMIPAFNAFKIPLEDAGEHTDTLTYLFRNSTIEMSDFSTAMNYLAKDIDTLGISMEDTAGIMLALADRGIQGSAATRLFRTAVTQASKAAEDAGDALKDLNDESKTLDKTQKDLVKTQESLLNAQKSLNTSVRDTALSLKENAISIADAKDRLAEMIQKGQEEDETAEQYNRRIEEQKLRIESLTYSRDDLLERQEENTLKLKENSEEQKENKIAQADTEKAIKDNYAAIQESTKNQDASAESLAKLYDELGITADQVEAYKVKIGEADGYTQKFADAQNKQYGTMDKLKQMYDEFKLSAGSALEPVEGMGAAMAAGGPLILGLTQMPALLGGVRTGLTLISSHPIILALTLIIAALVILELKFGILTKAAEILSAGFGWLSDGISAFIDWVVNAVDWMDVIGVAFEVLLGPIGWIMIAMDALGISWDDVWAGMISIAQGAVSFITGIIDGMVGGIKWAVNAVIDGINVMIRGLNMLNFDVPDWVPLIGGQSIGFNMQPIPRLAEGGIVTQPTIAMIGEAGPEAVVPLSGSNAGAGGVTIKIDKMEVRNDQDIQLVARELYTLIDRTNRGRGTI